MGNTLYITQGIDRCLWVFSEEQWKKISDEISRSTSIFQSKARILMRRILAPAQEIEIDKTGRINISPALRQYAGLSKECAVLSMNTYVEIWDKAVYDKYWEENESAFQDAAEDLGKLISM
ncbi:MAG: division/cell wall cluster transcriptional repressor MraZ [Spirochaetia bacterium]|nr:division/cell wall cluster transcriptional repressor MraZ [Spirochaetia bacterium]